MLKEVHAWWKLERMETYILLHDAPLRAMFMFLSSWKTSWRNTSWFGSWWHAVAGLRFTVCFFLICPRSFSINKEWRGLARVWCGWVLGLASAGWGVFPVGGGDEGEDGRLGREDVVPADLRTLLLPLLQQQPEDLVKVQPLGFLEVPLKNKQIERRLVDPFKIKPKWGWIYEGEVLHVNKNEHVP